MKRELLFAILIGIIFVGCSTKNEPMLHPQKLRRDALPESIYELSYQAFYSTAIRNILGLSDIQSLFNWDTNIDLLDIDTTTYDNITNVVNAYYDDGTFDQIIASSLFTNGIVCEIEQDQELEAQVMDSLIFDMQDSLYMTYNHRQCVFDDVNIGHNEKIVISFIYAINNWMYESLHSRTLVVKDNNAEFYFTMQIPSEIAPLPYTDGDRPWNLYEITLIDISSFEPDNILSYIQNEATPYLVFNSHEERELYLELLDITYNKQVTRQECDAIYKANIENVEATVAGTMAGATIAGFYNPPAVGLTSIGMLIYWAYMVDYYKKEHEACLKSATS